jgi:uncharacterized membrane protein
MDTYTAGAARAKDPGTAAVLMALTYPFAAHVAVVSGLPALVMASVCWLVALILLQPLRRGRPWAWGCLALVAGGLAFFGNAATAQMLLFLPPVAITAFMARLFGASLRQGETPLIQRIIRALHGPDEPLTPDILGYARSLTLTWTALFCVLATVNLVLAMLATPGGLLLAVGVTPPIGVPVAAWSLFANVLNYLIIGGMFAVEYAYRRVRFPQQQYRSFADFIGRVVRLGPLLAGTRRR